MSWRRFMPTRAAEASKGIIIIIKGILNACVIGLRAGFWFGSNSLCAEKMIGYQRETLHWKTI
jgi:hypothetical protein